MRTGREGRLSMLLNRLEQILWTSGQNRGLEDVNRFCRLQSGMTMFSGWYYTSLSYDIATTLLKVSHLG
jgi:hypothetical protein